MELLELTHCFADSDARLDDMLADLRLQRLRGKGRSARGMASRAVEQIRKLRAASRPAPTVQEVLQEVLSSAASSYDQLMATVRRAQHNLNPILSLLDDAKHAAEDRRTARCLLTVGYRLAVDAQRKSALVMWVLARGYLRRVFAQIATWTTPIRANGFFGTSKVDGRNLP